ncbi:copper chaperone PCu(A)C [Falsirhodobacter deserti]|uniref:copper chaperone PCu(A)C n=1 Tax=Falsirhodobacter deserti TaxID=1365611 RepID=UPI000FE39F65|nr:copper chaperone PCu(A)C [Falsirhodobacter deserti]
MFRTLIAVAAFALASPALAAEAQVAVTDAFARATLPGAPVGGAYMTLTADADDRLVSASTDAAGTVSIHEMTMKGGRMQMRAANGLPLPADTAVTLAPSGTHLMLEDLAAPLIEGQTITLKLTFENAAPVEVEVPVRAINAQQGHHHHH